MRDMRGQATARLADDMRGQATAYERDRLANMMRDMSNSL